MLLLARKRALAVICLLVSAMLYGADKPITVGFVYDRGDSGGQGTSAGLSLEGNGSACDS